jgi:hypothetical protein
MKNKTMRGPSKLDNSDFVDEDDEEDVDKICLEDNTPSLSSPKVYNDIKTPKPVGDGNDSDEDNVSVYNIPNRFPYIFDTP